MFTLLFLLNLTCDAHLTIKGKLAKSSSGDFIVTEQGGAYHLMLVRSITESHLILEEISTQPSNIDLKIIDWKKWIENRAPGATSWTTMVFDLANSQLTQCYSHLEKQWFFIEESDYFVKQLFDMPLRPSRENERKRIGPPPSPGEIDRRKLWKPQLIRDGKIEKSADFEVMRAKWPADKTKLAGCIFELYLDAASQSFPFPYWVEIQHPHYTFKMRTLDSGKGMSSPMPLLKAN